MKKNDIMQLVDPSLAGEFDFRQMNLMLLTASLCIQQSSIRRPSMRQVRCLSIYLSIYRHKNGSMHIHLCIFLHKIHRFGVGCAASERKP